MSFEVSSNNMNIRGPQEPEGRGVLPNANEPATTLSKTATGGAKVNSPVSSFYKNSTLEKLANLKATAAIGGTTRILRRPVAAVPEKDPEAVQLKHRLLKSNVEKDPVTVQLKHRLLSKQPTPPQMLPSSLKTFLKFADISEKTAGDKIQAMVHESASVLKSDPDLLEAIVNQAEDARVIHALLDTIGKPMPGNVVQKSWTLLANSIAGHNFEKSTEALSLFKTIMPEGDNSQRLTSLAKDDSIADLYFNNPDDIDRVYVLCKELSSEGDKAFVKDVFKALIDPKHMLQGMLDRKELDDPRSVHRLENVSVASIKRFIDESPQAGERLMKNPTIQEKFSEDPFTALERAANAPTPAQSAKQKGALMPEEYLQKLDDMYEKAHFDKKSEVESDLPSEMTAVDMKKEDLKNYPLYTKVVAKFDLETDTNVLNNPELVEGLQASEIQLQMLYEENNPAITSALNKAIPMERNEVQEPSDDSLYLTVYNASMIGDYSGLDNAEFLNELRHAPNQVQMLFNEHDKTITEKLQAAGFTPTSEAEKLFTEFGIMEADSNLPQYEKKREEFDIEKFSKIVNDPSVLEHAEMKEYLNTHNDAWIKLFAECNDKVSEAILDIGQELATENNLLGNLCHSCHAVLLHASARDLDEAQKEIDALDPQFKSLPEWKDAERAMNYAVSIKLLDTIFDTSLQKQIKDTFQGAVDEKKLDIPDPKEVKQLVETVNAQKPAKLVAFLRILADFSPNLCQFTTPPPTRHL